MKIVIIGSGTGALFTTLTIKKHNRDAEIIVIDKKDFELLHPCGLPYAIEGKIDSFDELKSKMPELGQQFFLKHEVQSVNFNEKKIFIKNLENNEEFDMNYDRLVIATGSSALIPPIEGAVEFLNKGLFTIDNFENAFNLSEYVKNSKSAIVVGAGAIGLETAVALKKKGLDVTIVEMLDYTLPKAIDKDISSVLEEHLKSLGIKLLFNSKLEKVSGTDKVESVIISGEEIKTDILVMAAGVKPNIDFLRNTELEIGKWAILVNEKMLTNIPDVYALGDCVQIKSLIDNRDWMMQLAVAAYKQGIIVGKNIVGQEKKYPGALTTFTSKIGDLELAATGFNSHFAGENIIIGKIKGQTKPEWCHGASEVTVKIIADKESGKILGAQSIGKNGAAQRINVISTAIQAGFNIYDLSDIELTYCPEISETYDVLMQAADNAIRKFEVKK
jgi:NADH oxidase (H2O2-forming)